MALSKKDLKDFREKAIRLKREKEDKEQIAEERRLSKMTEKEIRIEIIENRLPLLYSRIKLCDEDLKLPSLRDNVNILNKKSFIKEEIKILEEELITLKNEE